MYRRVPALKFEAVGMERTGKELISLRETKWEVP